MDDPVIIENPIQQPQASPYLILPVTDNDSGSALERLSVPEFVQRRPFCVSESGDNLILRISNLGRVASDLVKVDYQFVLCIDPSHGVAEGFTRAHAGEFAGHTDDPAGNFFLDIVLPKSSATVAIPIPTLPAGIANLYFRARVSTLWSKPVPRNNWDFSTDVKVTEYTKRFV
ncbi:hypothetical protein [Paraburkholderia sediminicola]|uniref:hypothetical protein n=1 Tax=Paraburkholderia sediminicola TaxID=458836 RepID=UPI0038B843C2